MFEWRVHLRNGHQNDFLKGDWTLCSKFVNHSRLKSQHRWGDLHDHSIRKRTFTFVMNKILI